MPGRIDPKYDADAEAAARSRRLPPPPGRQTGQVRTTAQPSRTWTTPQAGPPGTPWPQPTGPARSPVQVDQGYAPRTMGDTTSPAPPPRPAPPTLGERPRLPFHAWSLPHP